MAKTNKAYGESIGPLGIPMRDDVAKDVEALMKSLPVDCKHLIEQAGGPCRVVKVATAMDFVEGERADVSFITTDAVDRDFEVLHPKGGDFSQFKKNPIVTFAHKYDQLPVGRSMWLKREQKGNTDGWLAKTQYIAAPPAWKGDWFPDAVWWMVLNKILPGKSIGFIPLECRPPSTKEIGDRPELAAVRWVIPKWLALEYSVAPVQSNPDALVVATAKARKKGLSVPASVFQELGIVIPEEVPGLEPEQKQPEAPTIQRMRLGRESVKALLAKGIKEALKGFDLKRAVREEIDRMSGRI
jgi:hypothetical protein